MCEACEAQCGYHIEVTMPRGSPESDSKPSPPTTYPYLQCAIRNEGQSPAGLVSMSWKTSAWQYQISLLLEILCKQKQTRYTVNPRRGSSLTKVSPCWIKYLGIDSFDHQELNPTWRIGHSKYTEYARWRLNKINRRDSIEANLLNRRLPTVLLGWCLICHATTFNQSN